MEFTGRLLLIRLDYYAIFSNYIFNTLMSKGVLFVFFFIFNRWLVNFWNSIYLIVSLMINYLKYC